ncbi:Translation initiation factor IF-3 [Lacunisphaera limnophila]|uniref:Translation initiation factor IF-3 n=1 Tax=Lacunisphaera limnophila TaxID=1838286 RepID=A0A1D8AUW1_9BACT|nr:translation initiation factor IF-3 [Lacunisphaera limnophila]AOS44673.1 Translation initiation factor IF-3 [Lacunisphaera limnophila]
MALPSSSSGGRPPYNRDPRRNNDPYAAIRRNHRIKSPQVRVISPEGRQLGIMDTPKAIALALQFNLDLVEVAAAATPPVCRIMDFGKYVYEEQKKHAHSKPAGTKLKEIEFTVRIEGHDFETKLRHAEEFLDHGNKVKLRLKFRGREMAHPEVGFNLMTKALGELATMGHPDSPPKQSGKQINVMVSPLPANKRKPKFHTRAEGHVPDHPTPASAAE